jgi:rhodanese-related sulfurtransferase
MDGSLISPWMAWAMSESGRVQLIDVRSRDELPRVAGARTVPLDELAHELATLDRERPVVFLSGGGRKAIEAMELLRATGMTANAVAGGVVAWREAGLPLQQSSKSVRD